MTKETNCKGFTLVEMSLAIMVSSVLLTGLLPLYRAYITNTTITTTNNNMATIQTALASYQQINGVLPCPASPTAKPGTAGYSVSDTTVTCTTTGTFPNQVTTCTQACASEAPQYGTTEVENDLAGPANPAPMTGNVRIGVVPFATLGIPEMTAMDGWGNFYEYAVSENLADTAAVQAAAAAAVNPNYLTYGAITLYNSLPLIPANAEGPLPNHTPFVLISLGPTGHGAYTPAGVQHASCASSGPQQQNCLYAQGGGAFVTLPYSTSTNNAYRFDNIVYSNLGNAQTNPNSAAAACGDLGMLYGPTHPRANAQGCVPSMVEATAGGSVEINNPGSTVAPVVTLDVNGPIRPGSTNGGTNGGGSVITGQACPAEGALGYDLTNHYPVYCAAVVAPATTGVWTVQGGGDGIASLKCRYYDWGGPGALPGNEFGPSCTPPSCPAGWTLLGTGSVAYSDIGSGSSGYFENLCQAAIPYKVISLKCRFYDWGGPGALPGNENGPTCTPPACPKGWTSLFPATGPWGSAVLGSPAAVGPTPGQAAGYFENICYQ